VHGPPGRRRSQAKRLRLFTPPRSLNISPVALLTSILSLRETQLAGIAEPSLNYEQHK
jgi:hypothetical protein